MKAFLIAEYNALQARALEFEKEKSSRINFLLLVLGATIAGFSGLLKVDNGPITINYYGLAMALMFINLLIGVLTLKFSVDHTIAIISFHRKAGRIRHYFYKKNPESLRFLAFPPTDEKPRYYIGKNLMMWRGAEPVPLLLNALFAALIIFFSLEKISFAWRLSVSIIFFFSAIWTQVNVITNLLRERDKNDPVVFPKSSISSMNS